MNNSLTAYMTRALKALSAASVLLGVMATCAAAGKAGTTAANFLKIPVGPRQVGMGDQGVALPDDAFSVNYNPAGIALLNQQEVAFMHNQWVEGINQQYVGYANPKSGIGAIAGSINLLRVEPFDGFDANGARASKVDAQDLLLTGSYATRIWQQSLVQEGPALFAGGSVKYLQERLETNSASTYALDTGLLYRFSINNVSMKAGLAAKNIGPGVKYYEQESKLPATYALGVSAATRYLWGNPMVVSMEARKAVDSDLAISLGGENSMSSLVAFRIGYHTNEDRGPGIRAGMGFKMKRFQFDYGFSIMGDFGLTHRAGLTMRFGRQINRALEFDKDTIEVRKATSKAKKLISQKRYPMALLEVNRALEINARDVEALRLLDEIQRILENIESGGKP